MAFKNNPKTKLDKYIIQIASGGEDLEAFKTNIEQLDKMYEDISIVILSDGKVVYGEKTESNKNESENRTSENTPEKKKGFFGKLFGKK